VNQDELIVQLLMEGDSQRQAEIDELLSRLTPRERSLVRDAAVMGFVQGSMWGRMNFRNGKEPFPRDSAIFDRVVYAVTREEKNYKVLRGEAHTYTEQNEEN